MRTIVALMIAVLALLAGPASAQVLLAESYVEEWNPAAQQWVRIDDPQTSQGANRFASPSLATAHSAADRPAVIPALAHYGPFRVTGQDHAELVDVTDRHSPTDFAAMMEDFPAIRTLSMVEVPGTEDDRANLRLGRMIRAAGITTRVPTGGSVRSGGVELFLAGAQRQIEEGAEFAVHSWIDARGRQPKDFAMDAPANQMYLKYYQEMGMTGKEAHSFYKMTNSVSFSDAKWLTARDMRGWLGGAEAGDGGSPASLPTGEKQPAPVMAYLDLDTLLP